MGIGVELLFILLAILLNGFFAAAEIAIHWLTYEASPSGGAAMLGRQRLISGALMALSLLPGVSSAAEQTKWRVSQSPSVQLGVRNPDGTQGTYTAVFVVVAPDGTQYRAEKRVSSGEDSGQVTFPDNFNAFAQRGKYTWTCAVGGLIVLRGAFEYKSLSEVAVLWASTEAMDPQKQARLVKAQTDLRTLASAVSIYVAHTGQLPPRLTALTNRIRNKRGAVAGPFLATIPTPSPGWSQYAYTAQLDGDFTVQTEGDGIILSLP